MRARRRSGDPVRIGHLATVDSSLLVLLGTELRAEAAAPGCEVVAVAAAGPNRAAIEELGVEVVSLRRLHRRWHVRDDLAAALELWRVLPTLRLDVLHTHTPKAGVLGRIVGRLRGVPVVVATCHGLWATRDDRLAKRLAVYGAEAIAAVCSDAELYQNAEDRATMRFAVRSERSRLVGNGIDLERFRFDPDARAKVRAELGVADDEVVVGGVGRCVAEKGIVELGHAARALGDAARVWWVGPPEPDKADAVEAGAVAGIEFLGQRDDMVAVYSAIDVFVLPSYREGLPRSAMEAAACGRPLVLTDIRGSREVGAPGREVRFVPRADAEALTDALRELVEDAALRRRMGQAAHARAQAAFDQLDVARASIRTYWSVAARKGLDWPPEPTLR